jgi:hypothetical protein
MSRLYAKQGELNYIVFELFLEKDLLLEIIKRIDWVLYRIGNACRSAFTRFPVLLSKGQVMLHSETKNSRAFTRVSPAALLDCVWKT